VYFLDSSAFGGAKLALVTLLKGLDRSRWRAVLFHHSEPVIAQLVRGARTLGAELVEASRLDSGQRFRGAEMLLRVLDAQRHFSRAPHLASGLFRGSATGCCGSRARPNSHMPPVC
jgi:hypothetical protein